jgi:hypothetical protein
LGNKYIEEHPETSPTKIFLSASPRNLLGLNLEDGWKVSVSSSIFVTLHVSTTSGSPPLQKQILYKEVFHIFTVLCGSIPEGKRIQLEFLKSLWGLRTKEEYGYRTGPPGYIGWQNSFLGIDSWAP